MRKMIFPLAVGAAFACLATAAGAAFAQDVGQTIPAETAVPYASASVGDTLRVSSVEVFQDRSPSPTRGSVVIVRYFMNDVQNITASLNGAAPIILPTLASPDGEVFDAVPRAANGPVPVGEDLTHTAVFQIPLYATESSDDWKFQVGTFGTGVQVVLQ